MSDRFDRAVAALLGAGVLSCAAGALALRPAPLPAADAARWIALARHSFGDKHLFRRSWQIDAIDAGPVHSGYTERLRPLRRGELLAVTGWALDPTLKQTAAGVDYRVDGGRWRPARYHLRRPDVAIALGLTGSEDSGYTLTVATGALAPGRHELELATTGPRGRRPMTPTVRFQVTR